MTLRIVRTAAQLEQDDSSHQARLLVLLRHAEKVDQGAVRGITKLAKLDFSLRYPTYLKRLLPRIRKRPPEVKTMPFEEHTVENAMIRFKYGPWDHRYRRWLGVLVAKGLAETFLEGRTVRVRLTDQGRFIAGELAGKSEWSDLDARSELIADTAGRQSATRLKNLVYEVVPELLGMAWGEEIGV